MNDDLFDELEQSVREGGAILRGETEPARFFIVESTFVQPTPGDEVPRLQATCGRPTPDESGLTVENQPD